MKALKHNSISSETVPLKILEKLGGVLSDLGCPLTNRSIVRYRTYPYVAVFLDEKSTLDANSRAV